MEKNNSESTIPPTVVQKEMETKKHKVKRKTKSKQPSKNRIIEQNVLNLDDNKSDNNNQENQNV